MDRFKFLDSLAIVETAITWSGSIACFIPSKNPNNNMDKSDPVINPPPKKHFKIIIQDKQKKNRKLTK